MPLRPSNREIQQLNDRVNQLEKLVRQLQADKQDKLTITGSSIIETSGDSARITRFRGVAVYAQATQPANAQTNDLWIQTTN